MAKRNKKNDIYHDFKPVRIMSFDFYTIVFHHMMGIPLNTEEGYNSYQGSTPASLDTFQIWKLCSDQNDVKFMYPYKPEEGCTLCYTDALCNVSFSNKSFKNVKACGELASENKKLPQKLEKTLDTDDYYSINVLFSEFKSWYESNKDLHKAKMSLDEQERACKQAQKKAVVSKTAKEKIEATLQKAELSEQPSKFDEKAYRDSINGMLKSFKNLLEVYATIMMGMKEEDTKQAPQLSIRRFVYQNGFDIETKDGIVHYMVYKRSASKAKQGDCLFIWDRIRDRMLSWTWMGLPYKEKLNSIDLISAKAYESLVNSSIEAVISIDPKHILLIDSVESNPIRGNRRILVNENSELQLLSEEQYKDKKGKEFEHTNVIWDGQALVDESIFEKAGYTKNNGRDNRHGMMLLRNSFFKACGFRTKIKAFYKEKKIETVTDMFGRTMRAVDVDMIVTLDSLKLFKFAEFFFTDDINKGRKEQNSKDTKKSAKLKLYEYWQENLSPDFGIVKSEKASYLGHGKYHELSYQVLNTLPLSKQDMEKIMQDELSYLKLLKNNDALMMYRLRNTSSSVRKRYFIYTMLKYFEKFDKVDYYRRFLNQEIQDYKKRLRMGRIKVRGDFYVLCSMPLEMLEYSAFHDKKDDYRKEMQSYLKADQAYIQGMKEGESVVLFRSPHLNAGSVCTLTSAACKEYDQWFDFTNKNGSNIIVVSPWESNIMVKLGGADFDSDTALFVKDETIQEAAKRLLLIKMLGPGEDGVLVAQADPELKKKKKFTYSYCNDDMAKIDHDLSQSGASIGHISNDAQLFNSYLWKAYFSDNTSDCSHDDLTDQQDIQDKNTYMEKVYECVLKLSVLNELEIDRSKHAIDLNINKERKKIKETEIEGKPIAKHKEELGDKKTRTSYEKPVFMSPSGQGYRKQKKENGKKKKEYWNCPVDYIGQILDENKEYSDRQDERISFDRFMEIVFSQNGDSKKTNYDQVRALTDILYNASDQLDQLDRMRDDYDDAGRAKERNRIQQECMEKAMVFRKIGKETVLRLYRNTFETYLDDSKKGQKPHKKGDYKMPQIAGDEKIKYRYLGLLLQIGARFESRKLGGNTAVSCLPAGTYRRNILREIPEEVRQDYSEDQITEIWGIPYITEPDKSEDLYEDMLILEQDENEEHEMIQ